MHEQDTQFADRIVKNFQEKDYESVSKVVCDLEDITRAHERPGGVFQGERR